MSGGLVLILVAGVIFGLMARDRLRNLEEEVKAQKAANSDLLRRIMALERKVSHPPLSAPPVETPAPASPAPPPVVAPAPVPAVVRAPEPPPPPPRVEAPPRAERPPAPPSPPSRPPAPAWTVPPPPPPRKPFDWESLVGVKLFSWIAGILFALTAITFLRYSVEHGWLRPQIRMALGLVMGAGLLALCEAPQARRYATTANALGAAGIVALFSTFFAAHTLWNLIGAGTTFALLVLVTAVAVGLSIRHDALYIALLGLVGGFATPALLSSGEDHPFGLFGYLLLLNAGLAWVALRKSWPVLSALSLVFTTLYQWSWAFKFLDAAKLPLGLGIFLVFPLLGLLAPALVRSPREGGGDGLFARTAVVGAFLPLFFGLYLATVPAYGARYGLLFGFLFVLQVGIFLVAAYRGPRRLHSLAAGGTLLAFVLWLATSYGKAGAWPAILGFVSLFLLFDLAASWIADRLGRPLGLDGRAGAVVGTLLLFSFPVLLLLEPAAAAPGVPFGVLFVLLAAVAGFSLLYEDGNLHTIAAFLAIAAEAVWSARWLSPERLLAGIAIYAVFGLFYLGVPVLARRLGRRLRPEGQGAFLLLLALGLLFFLATGPLAQSALWGLALLLVILNAGIFLESGTLRRPGLAFLGTALSWALIAVWWLTVPLTASLVPALFLVAGFSVLGLAGNLWLRRWEGEEEGPGGADPLAGGLYLALMGHAFLLFVAAQPRLSIPPWPFLGVLLVLDLAAGVAALWLRRASLWIAALAASGAILFTWVVTTEQVPWPSVAVGSALAVAALGLLWIALARRIAPRDLELAAGVVSGAVVSLFLGQVVTIVASMTGGLPPLAFTVAAHLAFLLALLFLSELSGRRRLAPLSVLFTTAAVWGWWTAHSESPWGWELAFGAALYLPYLAFPLVLGERARRERAPFLAAVLASLGFFFVGRHALTAGGLSWMIGALPVAQAAALSFLLARLVRMERQAPTESDPGRLALVAGAVLAFLTAAIPLQLDREWITIGWALLAAALGALYLRVPHQGLLWWTAGLLAAVFLRLAANPAVLAYHPRGSTPIWNWYLYTYLVPALAFFLASWLLARGDDQLVPPLPRLSGLAAGGGVVLLFLLVNVEIADFFSSGASLTFGFLTGQASLAEDLAYTLGWALFAIALLVAGIVLRGQVARVSAIVLLLVAVLKGFVHDMARLGGLYRVASFAGLGVCLALMAVLIQKYVLPRREER